jgi:ABC-2 type transport system ATP-binding protein
VNVIAVEGISKAFHGRSAVSDLSFTVERGNLFGLLGPNGAGKTTTIRMILDLVRPDSGTVSVLGGAMARAVASRIGYLPEERGLYRDVSVLDGLVYFARLKGVPSSAARRRALERLEQVGLLDSADEPVRALSRGMQQQVQFLTTVLHQPELLIVDEPFSGLDPVNTLALRDLLLEMRAAGTTVVMSTHQMNRVQELCDRILMLNGGAKVLYGTVAEIRDLFGGDSVLVDADGDLEAVPGVQAVKKRSGLTELILSERVDPDVFLRQLLAVEDVHVRHFEVRTPSLEEIFIAVAGSAS